MQLRTSWGKSKSGPPFCAWLVNAFRALFIIRFETAIDTNPSCIVSINSQSAIMHTTPPPPSLHTYQSGAFDEASTEGPDKNVCHICWTLQDACDHTIRFRSLEALKHHVIDPDGSPEIGRRREWELGNWEALLDTCICHSHRRFFCFLLERNPDLFELKMEFSDGQLELSGLRYFYYQSPTKLIDEMAWRRVCWLLPIPLYPRPGIGIGRINKNPEFIDPAILQQWNNDCELYHGSNCKERLIADDGGRPGHSRTTMDWLIDAKRMCLVPAASRQPGSDYVALSYVWGQVRMLKTTAETLSQLLLDGILDRLADEIPATIRHAIKLVLLMGQRYLWVDALCIVQNDEASLNAHLEDMASIFENAIFTIVAADGSNADYGLPGLQNISRPRRPMPEILLPDGQTRVTIRRTNWLIDDHPPPWVTRGWTLQESIFSRKKLVFVNDTARWICRSNLYLEEGDSPHDLNPSYLVKFETVKDLSLTALPYRVPNTDNLLDLIRAYNQRNLSFDHDVMRALLSTFSALKRSFPRGFIHGLPVSYLDTALTWRSRWSRRRISSHENLPCPPSWTWAGWQGLIDKGTWNCAGYVKRGTHLYVSEFRTIPFLTWYTKQTKDGPRRLIPFQNDCYQYKVRFMGKSNGLPDGWTFRMGGQEEESDPVTRSWRAPTEGKQSATTDSDNPVSYSSLVTDYHYEHPSCPEVWFWHLVPLSSTSNDMVNESLELKYGHYLCTDTHQARLWGTKPTNDVSLNPNQRTKLVIRLFNCSTDVQIILKQGPEAGGETIGELRVETEEDRDRIWDAAPPGSSGVEFTLVAISRGFDYPYPQEAETEVYTFYNVLWVEWEDGIAYRKGVGRVKRRVWEALDMEPVALLLG